MEKGQGQKSANNGESRSNSGSGRRLAAIIVLLLLIGVFWFVVTDNPHVSGFRDKMLSHFDNGDTEDSDAGIEDSGTGAQDSGTGSSDAGSGSSGTGSSGNVTVLNTNDLPEFNGEHYVTVNNNVPAFPDEVYERAGYTKEGQAGSSSDSRGLVSEQGNSWKIKNKEVVPYEFYNELDDLGRCRAAYGCLGEETMPAGGTERGDISRIHPSGWAKAQRWERCHLIAWALSDENANESNLITGTHYLNHDGMRPLEEEVEHYIWDTGNHVLYMSRPIFAGDELVARGVQMVARSVEDNGKGISFNVYLFNTTPGAEINYFNGVVTTQEQAEQEARDYVINTRSGVFHYPTCEGAQSIYKKNRKEVTATRKELTDQGYIPCGYCEP